MFVAVAVGPGVGVMVIVCSTSGVADDSSVTRTGQVAVAFAGVAVGVATGVVEADREEGAVINATIPAQ